MNKKLQNSSLVDFQNISPDASEGECDGRQSETNECLHERAKLLRAVDPLHNPDPRPYGRYKYDCRVEYANIFFQSDEGDRIKMKCKSWDCAYCATWMRSRLIDEIHRNAIHNTELRRFFTITVDPDKVPETATGAEWLRDRWDAFMKRVRREYPGLSYIVVSHFHQGEPHRQGLFDSYVDQEFLSAAATGVGLGEVAWIEYVDSARGVAKYLTKYLVDGALSECPEGFKRYFSSQDITLEVRGSDEEAELHWDMLMVDYEYQEYTDYDGPMVRGVTQEDLFQQRIRGAPLGLDPPYRFNHVEGRYEYDIELPARGGHPDVRLDLDDPDEPYF